MSHAIVLVIGDNIEQQLQPYHEFECTGVDDEFVVFVPAEEDLQAEWEKRKDDYATLEEYADDYHGYQKNDQGVWGRRTNPNAKWDWWVVGGRYNGWLTHRGGHKVNTAMKASIDFEGMRDAGGDKAGETWDRAREIMGNSLQEFIPWEKVIEDHKDDIDKARAVYQTQGAVLGLRKDDKFAWGYNPSNFICSREDYVQSARDRACVPFAFVKDSKWYEKGKMGWWAIVADEKEEKDWNQEFNKMLDELPGDTKLTVVEYHI